MADKGDDLVGVNVKTDSMEHLDILLRWIGKLHVPQLDRAFRGRRVIDGLLVIVTLNRVLLNQKHANFVEGTLHLEDLSDVADHAHNTHDHHEDVHEHSVDITGGEGTVLDVGAREVAHRNIASIDEPLVSHHEDTIEVGEGLSNDEGFVNQIAKLLGSEVFAAESIHSSDVAEVFVGDARGFRLDILVLLHRESHESAVDWHHDCAWNKDADGDQSDLPSDDEQHDTDSNDVESTGQELGHVRGETGLHHKGIRLESTH